MIEESHTKECVKKLLKDIEEGKWETLIKPHFEKEISLIKLDGQGEVDLRTVSPIIMAITVSLYIDKNRL